VQLTADFMMDVEASAGALVLHDHDWTSFSVGETPEAYARTDPNIGIACRFPALKLDFRSQRRRTRGSRVFLKSSGHPFGVVV
jgi:hypothetical protein